jgi:DNA-binding response OmpR family regulator
MTRVLILEDDVLLASSLARALRARDHLVAIANTIAEANALIDCDLVLCDLGLPDGDGIDFIRNLTAQRPDIAIIALTARSEESDIITALISGAVGYITKPFRLTELLARVDAQLRLRTAMTASPSSIVEAGGLRIDVESRSVHTGDAMVELRPREFDVLLHLARSVGKVTRREALMREVWGENWTGSTKTLDVHVNSIRRKLGEGPGRPRRITAIRNVGYRLEPR